MIAGGGSAGSGNANHVLNDYDFIGAGLANTVGATSAGGVISAIVAGTNNVALTAARPSSAPAVPTTATATTRSSARAS